MKSFSIKALALAFIVVAGSAQAYTGEATVNSICKLVSKPYAIVTTAVLDRLEQPYPNVAWHATTVLSAPVRYYKTTRALFALGAAAVAYKTYKHFTKPTADATVEGENVEANQTN